jgi:AraC family transcriptional regulator
MMSEKQPLVIDSVDWPKLLPNSPLLTSFQSGWSSIQLAHCRQLSIDLPEISSSQHIVVIPLGHLGHHTVDLELISEGRLQTVSYREKDYASGFIEVFPADLLYRLRSNSTIEIMEWIQCCLEPTFVAQIAHESVNPDRVELLLTFKKVDLLIQQIGLALKSSLEVDGVGSRFYADSLATALSAHLLRHYSTREHCFREYEDGLSKQKLGQAVEYIQTHLGENLSLSAIATELEMSQYYFCRLFKQSTGVSPHQYLMQQRIERAKFLLRQQPSSERTITRIAIECGFANQSHLTKCFRQRMRMSPTQFREL